MTFLTRCLWAGAFGVGLLAGCSSGPTPISDHDAGTPDGSVCTAGQTKHNDCNGCSCFDGQWACTEMACAPDGGPSPDAGPDAPAECTAGQTKMIDCNQCSCSDGQWACTDMACLHDAGPDAAQCAPGDTKKLDCNTCNCQGGVWGCTTMFCGDSGQQHD